MQRWVMGLVVAMGCGGDADDKAGDSGTGASGSEGRTTSGDDDDVTGDDDDDDGTAVVDVLFVVDDSASMTAFQEAAAAEVATFVNGVEARGIDATYAVVTTTSSSLVGGAAITEAVDLANALRVGVAGADHEQGLAMAVEAAGGAWRRGVPLVVVGITDEEDCSHGGLLDGAPSEDCYLRLDELPPASDFVASLEALTSELQVFVFRHEFADKGCIGFPSERWAEAAMSTGGAVYSLCDGIGGSMAAMAEAL